MIYVNVRGNLGNQLFEYACARSIQNLTGQTICLNIYDLIHNNPNYKFDLDKYILNDNVIIEREHPIIWYANTKFFINRVIRKLFPNFYFKHKKKQGIYTWISSEYIELDDFSKTNFKDYFIDGYWQSTKYFKDIKDILINELQPKIGPLDSNKELYDKISSTESVCISIRRGDYVTNEVYKKRFLVCDQDYFESAVKKLDELVNDTTFFIFSDDVEWARNNLNFGRECYYESGNDTVFEKLRLMSACKHFIISNSSFSWWAQYLSTNINKVVVAPSQWYKDGSKTDIYEDFWNFIKTK